MNCEHTDCAAYSDTFHNMCRALKNTDFGDRECPFYKKKPAKEPEERKGNNE